MTIGRSHKQARPMRFMELDPPSPAFAKPCSVCISHKPNVDGYLYKTWSVDGQKRKEPFHRFILRTHLGWEEWPEGLETDHKCENRLCSEPSHLRPIQRSDHKSLTNLLRYAPREEEARCYWMATGCTGTALGERFGVSFSRGCGWIRKWKAETETLAA